jgi:dTDP-glucose 4,6-dehydratase/UDP-glucuronate decarboxylase
VVEADLDHILERAAAELAALSGKRLLVTGGAGFLGYYLTQAALRWNRTTGADAPISVTVVDSFARGVPDWIEGLERANLQILRHDIREPLPETLGHFEYVIHAAGIASPTYYRLHPIETMDANVIGLRLLLDRATEYARLGQVTEGFLFYSSSEIYGDPTPDQIPTPETYRGNVSCTGPRACYDESKRYGETLCVNFARQRQLPVTIARPFNNYGPGLKLTDRRVIPDLARNIFDGEDLALFSDGSATRTFCYVADAVVGYYKVLVKGKAGEPYNVGTEGPEISMQELATRMVRIARGLFGYSGRVVLRTSSQPDYLVDNPSRRRPDLSKALEHLDYSPSVELDDGLARTLVWYADNRGGEDA